MNERSVCMTMQFNFNRMISLGVVIRAVFAVRKDNVSFFGEVSSLWSENYSLETVWMTNLWHLGCNTCSYSNNNISRH